ncbi:MAG: hypothetical protein Q9167_005160 [Letrouitia subvulpina]
MDKASAQALMSLVPSLTGPLPRELLERAVSLLAQSRNKASSLKAEEEIARTYACAHLACERYNEIRTEKLKQPLGLPKIQPCPPCPPRIYQKLYRYLDSALPSRPRRGARSPRSTGGKATPTTSPVKPRKTPTKGTPSKSTLNQNRSRETQHLIDDDDDTPSWIMPAIRHLCKRTGASAAPHHVFAGVNTILKIPAPSEDRIKMAVADRPKEMSLVALIVAVFMIVRTRLSGKQTTAKDYPRLRDQALTIIRESPAVKDIEDTKAAESVGDWMREIGRGGWQGLDWFKNIDEGVGLAVEDFPEIENTTTLGANDAERDEMDTADRFLLNGSHANEDYLQPGLGTMMQDRVDYLSEKRRIEYQRWKKDILRRADGLEKAQRMNTSGC